MDNAYEHAKTTHDSEIYMLNPKTGQMYLHSKQTPDFSSRLFDPMELLKALNHHVAAQVSVGAGMIKVLAAAVKVDVSQLEFKRLALDSGNVLRVGYKLDNVAVTPEGFTDFATIAIFVFPAYVQEVQVPNSEQAQMIFT